MRGLIISGPCGVGKTTAGLELSSLLSRAERPHIAIDLDAYACVFPRDPDDPFGTRQALDHVGRVLESPHAQRAGVLIMAYVVETEQDLNDIADAISCDDPILVQLTATPDALTHRVLQREAGRDTPSLRDRALELHAILADAPATHRIDTTGQTPAAVGQRLFQLI